MNQITPEELFQIIGEQLMTIRKQNQELMRLQKEIIDSKPKEEVKKNGEGKEIKNY